MLTKREIRSEVEPEDRSGQHLALNLRVLKILPVLLKNRGISYSIKKEL